MKKNKLQKLLNNLDKNTEICKKIDSNIKDINQNIKYAPTDIINSFKTYTEPQTNILKIIEFYKITINCTQRIDDEMKNIHTITERSLIRAIQAHYNIKNELAKLEEYYEFNVIAKLRDKTNKQIHNIVEIVFHSFFKGFERGGDVNELKVMSRFLLENDESEYMLKYVKVMFYKYSVRNYAKDGDRVMKSLKNLKNTFGEIHTINVAYMSDAKAELLDKQIQQMLVVEYKDIIGKILMNLEHKYKDRNIVDACNWYLALRDKDIASLFVEFDDEILTVIFNLQIQFTNNIDSLRKPNKKLLNEDFIFNLFKVLNLFENPDLHKFFDLFGAKLDYKNYEEMKFVLGSMALDKIFDLSKSLKGIQKNIYLLNNIHLMATYCKEYQGTRIAEYIDRLCNEIVKMWKDQCDKRKGDATEFLNVNFEIQKDYYLPEEIRILVTERINKIVMDMLERCRYKDGKDMLELRLHELFRGK